MILEKDHLIEDMIFKKGINIIIRESSFNYTYLLKYESKSPNSRKITKNNFFKDTETIFKRIIEPNWKSDYVSNSGSEYWYSTEGVFRKADHWGKNVASTNWYLFGQKGKEISSWDYQGKELTGYSSWESFKDLRVKRQEKYKIKNLIKTAKLLEVKVNNTLDNNIKTDLSKKTALNARKNANKNKGYIFLYKDGKETYIGGISNISGNPEIFVEVYPMIVM